MLIVVEVGDELGLRQCDVGHAGVGVALRHFVDQCQHRWDQLVGALDVLDLAAVAQAVGAPVGKYDLAGLALDPLEAAGLGHCRFEQELWREQSLQFAGRGDPARLVVDHLPHIGAKFVDTVGDGGDGERKTAWADHDRARRLSIEQAQTRGASLVLLSDQPACQPLEARPPESALGRCRQQIAEMFLADVFQFADRVSRQQAGWMLLQEIVECRVQRRTAFSRAQFGLQGV